MSLIGKYLLTKIHLQAVQEADHPPRVYKGTQLQNYLVRKTICDTI